MPKIDAPMKRIIQLRPFDWARFIAPECQEQWVRPFTTKYTPKEKSQLDSVKKCPRFKDHLLKLMQAKALKQKTFGAN